MPRKSEAAIQAELHVVPRSNRKRLTDDLATNLRAIVDDIIASVSPKHFRDEDAYLLEMYAQAIVVAREAYSHLQREGFVIDGKKISPWNGVMEKAHRSAVALAGRLRLAPQQRMDIKRAARNERVNHLGHPIGSPLR